MKSTNIKAKAIPKDPNNPFSIPSFTNTKMPQISFTKNPWKYIVTHIDRIIQNLNTSKVFAGIMIIVLNIGSKFVNIKLSKSMEGYLKYTFSKQILVFAITWMGTRDIYIALVITILFTVLNEFIFNENSKLCCLPESFTNYHVELLNNEGMENKTVTEEDIQKATAILEKAKEQQSKTINTDNEIHNIAASQTEFTDINTTNPMIENSYMIPMTSESSIAYAPTQ